MGCRYLAAGLDSGMQQTTRLASFKSGSLIFTEETKGVSVFPIVLRDVEAFAFLNPFSNIDIREITVM